MTDTKELVERLRITSNMVNMGEKISWGQDTALMDEAAEALERLERERDEARAKMEDALERIASRTQTEGLLWWQIEARAALAEQQP